MVKKCVVEFPCNVGDYALFSDGSKLLVVYLTKTKDDINIGCQNGVIVSMRFQYPQWCTGFEQSVET